MKILYQINYVGGVGADRWISAGWRDAFESLGHQFFYFSTSDNLQTAVEEVKPDLLFLVPAPDVLNRNHWPMLRSMRRGGLKIFLMVDQSFAASPEKLRFYRESDIASIYWGENEEPWMAEFEQQTGREYRKIPLAANPKYHFPTEPVKKYQCDIVFLGAMMPFKRAAFEKLLMPLVKKYEVKIYGPNWTIEDNLLRIAARGARKVGLPGVNRCIQKLRISVPPEEENQLYGSAKICLNIHERGPEQKNHVFLNERGFKIPACGGFEICDNNLALRNYFNENEVVMADDDDDWFKKIDYYLRHDEERKKIQKAGTERALRDHTYPQRVTLMLQLAGFEHHART